MQKQNYWHKVLLLVFCFSCWGCGKTYETSIPHVSFNFSCNLAQSPYYKITIAGQFLAIQKNINGLRVGYGGLIIGRSIYSNDNSYLAYDAACPVEAKADVSLTVKDDGLGTAVCPHCGASFDLSNYGCRNDGKGSEVLRKYNSVTVNGNTLVVRN